MIGHCRCPCDDWGHTGCTGGFERSMPPAPHLDGYLHVPVCAPCYTAITAVTDRRSITPPH